MTDDKDIEQSQDPDVGSADAAEQAEASPVEDTPNPESDDIASAAGEGDAAAEAGSPEAEAESAEADEFKAVDENSAAEGDAEAEMMAMLEDLPEEDVSSSAEDINFGSVPVSSVEFQQLQQPANRSDAHNIDLLMDVDLPVSIELGRTKMPISDILALGPGSVVELNKLAGEPVDLLINHKVVAKGEVVVVDENFGLRITQLMTPEERLKALANE